MLLGTSQRAIDTYDIQPDIGELPDKKPKTRKELTSKRTRYSTRFANPDGSFTEEIYQQAQFYEDPTDKKWKKINNLLKKSEKIRNRFENTGNAFKTLFSEVSDSSNLFSVQKEGYSLDLLLVGAKTVNAVINQNEISYPDILPQVDVILPCDE